MAATTISTPTISRVASSRSSASKPAASICVASSTPCIRGIMIAATTAPTTISLAIPLANSTSERIENMRLAPARGEMRSGSGFSFSGDRMKPCCAMPEARAAATITSIGRASTAARRRRSPSDRLPNESWSTRISSGFSTKARSMRNRSRPIAGASMTTTSVPPSMTKAWPISRDDATSPRFFASSSRRCVGSSVFCESSRSSAIAQRTRIPRPLWKSCRNHRNIPDRVSVSTKKARPICSGMAMKKICTCGIRRLTRPSPR